MGTLFIGLILLSAYCYGSEEQKRPEWPKNYTYSAFMKSLTNDIDQRYTAYVKGGNHYALVIDINGLGNQWPKNEHGERTLVSTRDHEVRRYFQSFPSGQSTRACKIIKGADKKYEQEYYLPKITKKFEYKGTDEIGYFNKERWERTSKTKRGRISETVIIKYYKVDVEKVYPMPFARDYKKFTVDGELVVHRSYSYYDYIPNKANHTSNKLFKVECKPFEPYFENREGSQYTVQAAIPNTSHHKKLPKQFDWRLEGVVTPVKDQGPCECTWAFAAAGAMESFYYRKHKKATDVSVQMLVDCSWDNEATTNYTNQGCFGGGYPKHAFDWMDANGGILRTADYGPYLGIDGHCNLTDTSDPRLIRLNKFEHKYYEVEELKKVLINHGPVAVGFHVKDKKFKSYKSGIIDVATKKSRSPTIAGLLVGYGTKEVWIKKKKKKVHRSYWLVKMSLGTKWGLDGYVLLRQKKLHGTVPTK